MNDCYSDEDKRGATLEELLRALRSWARAGESDTHIAEIKALHERIVGLFDVALDNLNGCRAELMLRGGDWTEKELREELNDQIDKAREAESVGVEPKSVDRIR